MSLLLKIFHRVIFAAGYVVIVWLEVDLVKSHGLTAMGAALGETVYILFGSIYIVLIEENQKL